MNPCGSPGKQLAPSGAACFSKVQCMCVYTSTCEIWWAPCSRSALHARHSEECHRPGAELCEHHSRDAAPSSSLSSGKCYLHHRHSLGSYKRTKMPSPFLSRRTNHQQCNFTFKEKLHVCVPKCPLTSSACAVQCDSHMWTAGTQNRAKPNRMVLEV